MQYYIQFPLQLYKGAPCPHNAPPRRSGSFYLIFYIAPDHNRM